MTGSCEWADCSNAATHTVMIDFPGEERETWRVCRAHDKALNNEAVESRPRAEPPTPEPVRIEAYCKGCGFVLNQPSETYIDDGQPCPKCGSAARHVTVSISETVGMHDSVKITAKRAGKGGWITKMRAGADYTRRLDGWGSRELTTDRATNTYREVIELHDGTRIESAAKLTDKH